MTRTKFLEEGLLGSTDLENDLVTNCFVLSKPILTFGHLKSFEKALPQPDVVLDISVNPGSGPINRNSTLGNAFMHHRHEVSVPAVPQVIYVIRSFG